MFRVILLVWVVLAFFNLFLMSAVLVPSMTQKGEGWDRAMRQFMPWAVFAAPFFFVYLCFLLAAHMGGYFFENQEKKRQRKRNREALRSLAEDPFEDKDKK